MQNTLHLTIGGMHCGACVNRVTTALHGLPGVQAQSVEVGSAHVSFDPAQTSPTGILAAVNNIGFQASIQDQR